MVTDPAEAPLKGRMLFYQQPELLSVEEHGSLGLIRPERAYEYAATAKAIPVTAREFSTAQKYYPIVFSNPNDPVPVAVTGIDDKNLFVDENGRWQNHCYVPAYLRCYPLTVASSPDGNAAVVVDRTAAHVSANPDQPFFDGKELTEGMKALVDFCSQYDAERRQTIEFGKRLKELELLTGQQATQQFQGEEPQTIASYTAIDARKLRELDPGVLQELFKNGSLSMIYAHLFSLENWQRLIERRALLTNPSPPPAQH